MRRQQTEGRSSDKAVIVTVESDVRDYGHDDLDLPSWLDHEKIVRAAIAEYHRQRKEATERGEATP